MPVPHDPMDAMREELAYARARIVELEKAQLHHAFDRLLEGCMVLRRDWTLLYLNEAAARPLREKVDGLIGRIFLDVLPGIEKTPIFTTYRRCMEQRLAETFEAPFTFADGTVSWFRFSVEPVPEGIFVLSLDITERVVADNELRQRRDQLGILARGRTAELEAVFDSLAMPVMVFDAGGRVVRANAATRDTFGVDLTALDAGGYEALVLGELGVHYPDGRPLTPPELPMRRALRGEILHRLPLILKTATGTEAVLEASAIPLQEGQQVVGAVVVWHDVSQRAHVEQELRLSEARYRTLVDLSPDAIFINRDDRVAFVNSAALGLFGAARAEQLIGRQVWDLFHPEVHAVIRDGMQLVRGGEPVPLLEEKIVRLDGEVRYVEVAAALFADREGQAVQVILRDVTERRYAEERLRRAHDDLEIMVRARTAELTEANRTLRMISACNEALVRATDEIALVTEVCQTIHDLGGYRMAWVGYAEQDEAKTVRTIAAIGFEEGTIDRAPVTWADTERGRGPTGRCIRTGVARVCEDFRADPSLALWREEAELRDYRSAVALPLKASGKVLGALTIYADRVDAFGEGQVALLTELADDLAFGIVALRAQVERDHALELAEERTGQLRALAVELGQTEHRERERLARVLHDHLQQLLVGAKLGIAAVEDKLRTKTKQKAIRRVVGILDEAIQASRSLTAELSPPALHAKGLGAGLEWLAGQMKEKHGLEVEVRAQADAEPGPEELRLVLFEAARELLFNVVKHAGVKRARVSLVRAPDKHLVVTVADNGAGFDARALEAGPTGGTGFGLFHIRERLSYLGGRLEIDSVCGHGSRFMLTAPLGLAPRAAEAPSPARAPGPSSAAATPAASGARESGRKIRVLLADDHPVMREGLVRVFAEQPDIEVVGEAGDGVEALELSGTLRPDVVVMDVGMPRASGVDVTKILRAGFPEVQVVGLSMHDGADVAGAMRKAGAAAYLTKDGPVDELISAVRAASRMVAGRTAVDGGRRRRAKREVGMRKRAGGVRRASSRRKPSAE